MKNSLYDILEVDKNSSKEEIKKSYRKKSKKCHPDMPGGNTEKFKELSIAFNILIDDSKRKKYDETGNEDFANKIDDLTSEAIRRISMIFTNFLDNLAKNNLNYNIMESIKNNAIQVIHSNKKDIRIQKKLKKNVNNYKKRIKYKGKDQNILIMFCDNKIKDIDSKIPNFYHEIEVAKKVIELLEGYDLETIINNSSYSSLNSTSTSTTTFSF